MNLVEVVAAASVFLGACSGAAQLGAASTQAMQHTRWQQQAVEQSEAQFLAAPAVLQAARQAAGWPAVTPVDCPAAARWMQQQLVAGLPAPGPGIARSIDLTPQGHQVVLALRSTVGLQRVRLFSPAAFGLCGGQVDATF